MIIKASNINLIELPNNSILPLLSLLTLWKFIRWPDNKDNVNTVGSVWFNGVFVRSKNMNDPDLPNLILHLFNSCIWKSHSNYAQN